MNVSLLSKIYCNEQFVKPIRSVTNVAPYQNCTLALL